MIRTTAAQLIHLAGVEVQRIEATAQEDLAAALAQLPQPERDPGAVKAAKAVKAARATLAQAQKAIATKREQLQAARKERAANLEARDVVGARKSRDAIRGLRDGIAAEVERLPELRLALGVALEDEDLALAAALTAALPAYRAAAERAREALKATFTAELVETLRFLGLQQAAAGLNGRLAAVRHRLERDASEASHA